MDALGSSVSENRRKPYVPIFSSTAARITEPPVGASTCASGSQVWNGNMGTLMAKPMSMLGIYDPETPDMTPDANASKALRLMSQTPTIVTTFDRLRKGLHVIGGDPSMSFAENFLYTLTGKRPDDVMEHAFDVALTLHADHELNASTFAARVTAATLSDIYSSITSAIGALKGPLHGGAN